MFIGVNARPHDAPRSLLSREKWRSIAALLGLSKREFQIVLSVFDGHKETVIACELGISTHTIHSHVKRLYRKLDVSDHSRVIVRIFEAYLTLDSAKARRSAAASG